MSRINFPASVVNARIAESITVFYESMDEFFKKQGWKWIPYRQTGNKWIQEDFLVEIKRKFSDGAIQELLFTMYRIPGIVGQPTKSNRLNIGYSHKFSIMLPREYPANLSHIKMRAVSPLWHPRISMGRGGDACITVNGEVDRILIDIIYHILMDPKRIRPPKLYPKEDSGMNVTAMRWFEKDADDIHNHMLGKWDAAHEKSSLKDRGGIRIIGGEKVKEPEKKGKSIRIMPKKADKEEKDEGGIRII
ncbi:MAG: hypothetical protein FK730_15715 [Asgard group archaeon]|nr:hypothetical protein [Asgard group archaeon]